MTLFRASKAQVRNQGQLQGLGGLREIGIYSKSYLQTGRKKLGSGRGVESRCQK
jgi:hypothetical protein